MKLKLLPQTPVYWTNSTTLKIGFDDPVELSDVQSNELKLIDLLRKGTSTVEVASHVKIWGIPLERAELISGKAKPVVEKIPKISVYGSGVLATAMSEAMQNVFSPTDKTEVAVLVGNWAIPSNSWRKFSEAHIPHLAIIQQENAILVGPIVRSGITPCLRCSFLAQSDQHPDLLKLAMQRGISNTTQRLELLSAHRLAAQLALALIFQDPGHGWKVRRDLSFEKYLVNFHQECGCK